MARGLWLARRDRSLGEREALVEIAKDAGEPALLRFAELLTAKESPYVEFLRAQVREMRSEQNRYLERAADRALTVRDEERGDSMVNGLCSRSGSLLLPAAIVAMSVTPRWIELQQRLGLPRLSTGGMSRYRITEVEAWLREHCGSPAETSEPT